MLKNKCFSYTKQSALFAFSLAEALISLLIISVVVIATMPIITQMSQLKTGIDKHAMNCIINDASEIGYDTDTGDTTMPSAGTACYVTVTGAQYGTENVLDTIKWRANHGESTAEQTAAKIILRTVCDQGGESACDYFINKCLTDGSETEPYCDVPSSHLDITYYLKKPDSTTNYGARYIIDKLEKKFLPYMAENLMNEVFNNCIVESSSISCTLDPEIYIKACNSGYNQSCIVGYNKNYNQSCTEIKTAWQDAPTGNYKLTYPGDPAESNTPVEVSCTTVNLASAAITGCSADPYVSGDCTAGFENEYNRTCEQIFATWPTAPSDLYNLTTDTADPSDYLDTNCTLP